MDTTVFSELRFKPLLNLPGLHQNLDTLQKVLFEYQSNDTIGSDRLNRWVQGRTKINLKHLIWLLYHTHYIPHNGKQLWANATSQKRQYRPAKRTTQMDVSRHRNPLWNSDHLGRNLDGNDVILRKSHLVNRSTTQPRRGTNASHCGCSMIYHSTKPSISHSPNPKSNWLCLVSSIISHNGSGQILFDTKYLVDHTNDPSFTNGRLVVNLNDPIMSPIIGALATTLSFGIINHAHSTQ